MSTDEKSIAMEFCGIAVKRNIFLKETHIAISKLMGHEIMFIHLIHEIAKNIYDHAKGKGSLIITQKDNSFEFEIKDNGQESYDFNLCKNNSRLIGNEINFGIGLFLITEIAKSLKIDLKIDTSKGFRYSGIYTPKKS